ncbi:galactose oxidase [Allokutzneria sp. A3M-2-11 16]|uniref:galactose oxidase n=1 Tax=Allokutzneria sp. A3M-2-11 16 TaxID=2962043 RepID=UPI0020B740DD|nr:galactose oxidase [Allokutzneria sp. A3M-2-11 16]MCP3803679.1 galactose oxidase [Allokutzneria sp. A3M-2-11 16]
MVGFSRRAFAAASLLPLVPATARASTSPGAGWSRLAPLPPNPTAWHPAIPVGKPYWRQLGLAGPVAGVHAGHLIVAGGANFPEPAKTSNRQNALGKVYWNDVFVMAPNGSWSPTTFTLPNSLAYSACVSTSRGVLVIGGEGFPHGAGGSALTPVRKSAEVFYLRYDARRRMIEQEQLPPLPRPMSYGVAGIVDDVVYVAEGADFYSLDLARPGDGWRTLPSWPGDPRSVAVGAVHNGRFYLLSGRAQTPEGWRFHRDAYAYSPRRKSWRRIADLPWCVTAGLAYPTADGLLVLGGDRDLERWNLIQEQTASRDREPKNSPRWHEHNDVITWIYDHHTGFTTEVLRYDPARDSWRTTGHFPGPPPATTPAVLWREHPVVVSGEIRPGVRTPVVWKLS